MSEIRKSWKIDVIRSRRRTVSVQVRQDLTVLVRAPYGMSNLEIRGYLERWSDWIDAHIEEMERREKERLEHPVERLSEEEVCELARRAAEYIPGRVEHFAGRVGVTYGRITIRNQRTKWGSCSAKGNLNFNCLLMLAPPEVLDYVVVHELCHRLEMNHSGRFWELVSSHLPEYRKSYQWLKENGEDLMRRAP